MPKYFSLGGRALPTKQLCKSKNLAFSHSNAIWIDYDGNLLLSSFFLSEITKIDRKTGKIIWRLGGKSSDFTFINDRFHGFTRQHTPSRLKNGNILMCDNGVFHEPPTTRVVEYALDEKKKTATLVWEYVADVCNNGRGSCQRLENGNTFIGWSRMSPGKKIIEVTPEKKIVLELEIDKDHLGIYRAYKIE